MNEKLIFSKMSIVNYRLLEAVDNWDNELNGWLTAR